MTYSDTDIDEKIAAITALLDAAVGSVGTAIDEAVSGAVGGLYPGYFDSGNTAWILSASALVLMMNIPGLALYYGGMVRSKNILACIMQVVSITCLVTFLWLCFGYSLSFAPVNTSDMRPSYCAIYADDDCHSQTESQIQPFLGDASRFWLVGTFLSP